MAWLLMYCQFPRWIPSGRRQSDESWFTFTSCVTFVHVSPSRGVQNKRVKLGRGWESQVAELTLSNLPLQTPKLKQDGLRKAIFPWGNSADGTFALRPKCFFRFLNHFAAPLGSANGCVIFHLLEPCARAWLSFPIRLYISYKAEFGRAFDKHPESSNQWIWPYRPFDFSELDRAFEWIRSRRRQRSHWQ